ncbi:hypothetical protein OPQ81_008891 [Rhizoctonia solani]|nr:hypothetical protein OPQ81_008891 [Rhizoctonia solani]
MSGTKVGPAISIVEAQDDALDRSDARLEALGYRPEFRREMNLFAVVGMSFTAIGILTGMSSAFQTGLFAGGPLGLFWGWNICALFMFLVALCLAEICSAYPTMGGLYYWVSKMKSDKPILGYVTGVLYACAMIFTGTSGNLSTALYIASMAEVGTGITLSRVEITGMAWCVCLLSAIINSWGSRGIGMVSQVNVWWTLVGTIILVVTLLVKSPVKNSALFVFTDLENFTGWGNNGFVVLLGFLQAVYTLEGAETSAQVAEEARNAEWLAPIGIAASIVGSWFIEHIVCHPDRPTGHASSWRLAPWVGVWLSATIAIIISAAYIGSVVAFNAILSSAAIAVMLSYLQPILCRVLWPESMEVRGPFHLGKYSRAINAISALFTVFVCVLFILPTSMPVDALNMNYSIVAIGAVLILILSSWVFYGQYHFKGPVSTVDMPPLTEDGDEDKKTS